MQQPLEPSIAVDVCRPDSDDLALPELAGLAAVAQSDPAVAAKLGRIEQLDRQIVAAVREGDVPAGLADGILAMLAAADDPGDVVAKYEPASPAPTRRTSRRRLFWMSSSIAAAIATVVCGVAVWSLFAGPDRLTESAIRERADQWCEGLDASAWRTSNAPRKFLPSRDVRWPPVAWQWLELPEVAGRAAAYRIPVQAAGVDSFTLLVFRAEVAALPPFPPVDPHRTQGRLISAWQIGDLVHVVVLRGDDLGALQDVYRRSVETRPIQT